MRERKGTSEQVERLAIFCAHAIFEEKMEGKIDNFTYAWLSTEDQLAMISKKWGICHLNLQDGSIISFFFSISAILSFKPTILSW